MYLEFIRVRLEGEVLPVRVLETIRARETSKFCTISIARAMDPPPGFTREIKRIYDVLRAQSI
jgi:hypothetical protein